MASLARLQDKSILTTNYNISYERQKEEVGWERGEYAA
jgi:hypothetical protein